MPSPIHAHPADKAAVLHLRDLRPPSGGITTLSCRLVISPSRPTIIRPTSTVCYAASYRVQSSRPDVTYMSGTIEAPAATRNGRRTRPPFKLPSSCPRVIYLQRVYRRRDVNTLAPLGGGRIERQRKENGALKLFCVP